MQQEAGSPQNTLNQASTLAPNDCHHPKLSVRHADNHYLCSMPKWYGLQGLIIIITICVRSFCGQLDPKAISPLMV
jgi:hypothetical protein